MKKKMVHNHHLFVALVVCLTSLPLISCGGGGGGGGGGSSSSSSSSSGGTSSGSSSGGIGGVGAIPYTLTNQDTAAHAPPTTGSAATYDYNLFTPNASNFPIVGNYYFDPVFGAPIRRLTNVMGNANQEDIYAHHWANTDGSYAFHDSGSGLQIVRIADGTPAYSNQPLGDPTYELYWDALDPNKYYYYNGASLMVRDLLTQTSSVKKTFAASLNPLGGSLNFQTANGRYFVIEYNGQAHVWDSQTDTIYAGAVPFDTVATNGWITITPNGSHLVSADGWTHKSYAINHTAKSVSTTGVMFWSGCGDHGVVTSPSDGKSYFVTYYCYNDPAGVYRVDITQDLSGVTQPNQYKYAQMLVPIGWPDLDGHLSAVSRGPLADWVFADTESFNSGFGPYDDFNSSTAGWTPYKQEVIAVNVITGVVRRLAQHRSRGLALNPQDPTGAKYFYQPRVSCSWDGSAVLWVSNHNVSSPTGYADMYVIQLPIPKP